MTDAKFEDLWVGVKNIAEDIENSCRDKVHFNEEKKLYVQYEYDNLRRHCKQHLSKNAQSQSGLGGQSEPLLDRHKVAACIAGAILRARPMDFDLPSGKSHYNLSYLCNESLALFSALGIIKSFIRSDSKNVMELDPDLKKDFLAAGFLFPKPVHSDYLPWLLFLLQESFQIGFNVLSFSNILFLLETYTFAQLKISKLGSGQA